MENKVVLQTEMGVPKTYFYLLPVFLKTAGGIALGSIAVSADVLLHISGAIKASILKFDVPYMQKQYC